MPEQTFKFLIVLCNVVETLAVVACVIALVLLVLAGGGGEVTDRPKDGDQ